MIIIIMIKVIIIIIVITITMTIICILQYNILCLAARWSREPLCPNSEKATVAWKIALNCSMILGFLGFRALRFRV